MIKNGRSILEQWLKRGSFIDYRGDVGTEDLRVKDDVKFTHNTDNGKSELKRG